MSNQNYNSFSQNNIFHLQDLQNRLNKFEKEWIVPTRQECSKTKGPSTQEEYSRMTTRSISRDTEIKMRGMSARQIQ